MKTKNRQKLIVVLGPTASGKTALARRLAKEFGGFIISADSRQAYRYMDIGTGKVDTQEELDCLKLQRGALLKSRVTRPSEYALVFQGVPHYMIDIVEPSDEYNVAMYQRDVYNILTNYELRITNYEARQKNRFKKSLIRNSKFVIPIMVGGTGLYIDAVVDNWHLPPGEPNYEVRAQLEKRIEGEGIESVWNELIARDPECARFVQKNNPRRVVRALEYVLTSSKKFSEERGKGERMFDVLKIGISLPREELYKKIDARVDARFNLGMVQEVRNLHEAHGLSLERLRQFGLEYRVIADYLSGKFSSLEEMSERLKWDSHSYARRQMTWFRRDKEIQWISGGDEARQLVEQF